MPKDLTLSDTLETTPKNFQETEVAIARKDGLALLDDLIHIFYNRVLENIEDNFKPGDLIRMIELRYKLSPTNAEQEKFWAMLSKIRRDVLNNPAGSDKPKKKSVPQKSAIERNSAIGRIRQGEHKGE